MDHSRITFPLRELDGTLVGISGRDFTETAKLRYKIYDDEYEKWGLPRHDTHKSQLLWNGHIVYPQLYHETMPIILVEGFKACMKVVQAGAFNTVATLGNRPSYKQRNLCERMGSEIWLFYDNNAAGLKGSVISGMEFGLPVRIVPYPDEREQPSDLTSEEIQLALMKAQDFTRWLLDSPKAWEVFLERKQRLQEKRRQYEDD
jgi:DNA primase